ncbi:MAG: CBS domain-containing protein [candidate division NC10 bacterium]|nr:CBS domain-containing protein [candidate division NC10 bacterium]
MLVENRMKRDPITISPETGILEASRLLRQHKIRHLPVVRGGRLVGILTDRDLKRVSPSPATNLSVSRVEIVVEDTPAALYAIGDIVRERAGDIASIMTAGATYRGEERKVLIVRIETDDPEETVKAIEKAGYPVLSAAV